MIGLIFGETEFPKEILKKIEKKYAQKKTGNYNFKNYHDTFFSNKKIHSSNFNETLSNASSSPKLAIHRV